MDNSISARKALCLAIVFEVSRIDQLGIPREIRPYVDLNEATIMFSTGPAHVRRMMRLRLSSDGKEATIGLNTQTDDPRVETIFKMRVITEEETEKLLIWKDGREN